MEGGRPAVEGLPPWGRRRQQVCDRKGEGSLTVFIINSLLSVVILDVIQHCEGKKQESKAQVLTEESDY